MTRKQKIKFIPNKIGENFQKVTALIFSGNSIESINKKVLSGLKSLKKLFLDENEIQKIPEDSFDDLIELEVLDLDENKISFLSLRMLQNLRNLKEISVHDNEIQKIEGNIFTANPNLEIIKMQNNKIYKLSPELINNLPKLKVFNLKRNECVDKIFLAPNCFSTYAIDIARDCTMTFMEVYGIWIIIGCSLIFLILLIIAGYFIHKKFMKDCKSSQPRAINNPDYDHINKTVSGASTLGSRAESNVNLNQIQRKISDPSVRYVTSPVSLVNSNPVKSGAVSLANSSQSGLNQTKSGGLGSNGGTLGTNSGQSGNNSGPLGPNSGPLGSNSGPTNFLHSGPANFGNASNIETITETPNLPVVPTPNLPNTSTPLILPKKSKGHQNPGSVTPFPTGSTNYLNTVQPQKLTRETSVVADSAYDEEENIYDEVPPRDDFQSNLQKMLLQRNKNF